MPNAGGGAPRSSMRHRVATSAALIPCVEVIVFSTVSRLCPGVRAFEAVLLSKDSSEAVEIISTESSVVRRDGAAKVVVLLSTLAGIRGAILPMLIA